MTVAAEKSPSQNLNFPGFLYRGFEIPALEIPAILIDNLGTNQTAYVLAPKSIPLSWRVGLYLVGRDIALGVSDAESLPTDVKKAAQVIYSDCQVRKGIGGWHKDAVLIEPEATIPGNVRPGPDYVAARFFKEIEGFKDEGRSIKSSPDTREYRIWLPKGEQRFIVPTMDGAYHPMTGTPLETIESEKEAVKRWMQAGLTENQAGNELSRFYRMNSGLAAVGSWSSGRGGPLCVDLDYEPRCRDPITGSFPASRSAERSEAPKNSRFKLLIDEEYRGLLADRKKLQAVRDELRE